MIALTFETDLRQFDRTGDTARGAQVKLVLKIKGLYVTVNEPTSSEPELKMEKDAASTVAANAGTSTLDALSVMPLKDRVMKQKMAASIILAVLSEKIASEVYLMDNLLTMIRHLRLTYNVKCSAKLKREYMGLYLDGDDAMVEQIKTTRRVLDELQK
uniref:Uncharacterized protein n=1 Tax=Peronospora matthiolae TaxID=2874970 RepID=A0AAV1TN87_9STRA